MEAGPSDAHADTSAAAASNGSAAAHADSNAGLGAAPIDDLRQKQQQLNSLALAFLADAGNMQRAFAAAQAAAQRGDDSGLKAVYAASQIARQLEARQLQKQQAEAAVSGAATVHTPGAAEHMGQLPLPMSAAPHAGHSHPAGVTDGPIAREPTTAALPDMSGSGSESEDSSHSDDDRPAMAAQADHPTAEPPQVPPQQQQQQQQAQKPKAPVIKLKLSGTLMPGRQPGGAHPQRQQDPAAVKIELAPGSAARAPQRQDSSSDASISDSDSDAAPAQRPRAGTSRQPAPRAVHAGNDHSEARRMRVKRLLGLAPPEGSPFAKQPCMDGVRALAIALGAAR